MSEFWWSVIQGLVLIGIGFAWGWYCGAGAVKKFDEDCKKETNERRNKIL